MARLIADVFHKAFDNDFLRAGDDQSVFDIAGGRMVMTTDGYVVWPLFLPGGNIGVYSYAGPARFRLSQCRCRQLRAHRARQGARGNARAHSGLRQPRRSHLLEPCSARPMLLAGNSSSGIMEAASFALPVVMSAFASKAASARATSSTRPPRSLRIRAAHRSRPQPRLPLRASPA